MTIARVPVSQKGSPDLLRIARFIMVLSFFLFFMLSFLRIPVHNEDFWWHLATGKYILENRSLPENDPFAYTAGDLPAERKSIILKGNWLAEVIFYKIYALWEFKGIIILRSLLLLLFLFFVFLNIKKQEASVLVSLILTGGVFLVARTFPGERPQLFTFFVFSLVYYLLEDFRINGSKKVFLIPILVMLLSNMHPGYIICVLLITLYLLGEGARYFLSKDYKDGIFKGLLIIWILTVIFSTLNPNGATMLTEMFSITQGEHIQGIVEFMPTFVLYANKITRINYSYIIFLLFSLLSLLYMRRIGIVHMLLLIVFTVISFVALRYQIFYICVAAPILARIIINLRDEKVFKELLGRFKLREGFFHVVACIMGVLLVFNTIPSLAIYDFGEETFYFSPKNAADFLRNVEIRGNMFNEYGFGGYLIWRLYPQKKVFIDGRGLEPDVYKDYNKLINAGRDEAGSWEDIIKKYNISYVVIPPLFYDGDIFGLVEQLFISEDWVLIYMDHLSLIFLRDTPDNSSLINKFAIDKNKGLQTIVVQSSSRAMQNPRNIRYLISLGKVFFKMGRLDEAKKAFMMAYQRDPDNQTLKFWIQKLEKYGSDREDGR